MHILKKNILRTTRFRTTLWYAGLFILLEIISGVLVYTYLRKNLFRDLDSSLTSEAYKIHEFVSAPAVGLRNIPLDSSNVPEADYIYNLIFEAIVVHPRDSYIQIKLDNNLIYLSDNLRGHRINLNTSPTNQLTLINFTDSLLSSHNLRAAHLVKNKDEIIVAVPTVLIDRTLQHIINLNLFLIPFFLLLAIVGGAIISAKSLSRIDSIIKKTEEITAQNLDEIIPGGERDDEYGRLVRTMNDMIRRIKTSLDFMNQFSSSVSHELKTPLTILQGEIEVALRSPKSAQEYKKILQSNYEETLYLTSIVDKFFLLSKIDHSELKIRRELVDIIKLIRPIIHNLQTAAKKKNIEIILLVKNNFNALLDIDLMGRAIYNLIENAIKYGYPNTQIKISAYLDENGNAIISVNNVGRFIPKELHIKIFERFYRSETSRNLEPGGIGLGLAITKSIVEYHGGKIWAESDPDIGTTFLISFKSQQCES